MLGSPVACSFAEAPTPVDAEFMVEWMNVYYAVARLERLSPPVASRIFAYGSVALYEALARGDSDLMSLAGQLNGLYPLPEPDPTARLDWPAVATAAEFEVLRTLLAEASISAQLTLLELAERQLERRAGAGVSESVRAASVEYGHALGSAIASWANGDDHRATRGIAYDAPDGYGSWVNTTTVNEYTARSVSAAVDYVALDNPGATLEPEIADERSLVIDRPRSASSRTLAAINPTGALEPYWSRLRLFSLASLDECAPPPPAPYSEDRSSEFHHQVRATYEATMNLDEEQRESAFFWADNPGQTATPAGHWISIVSQLTSQAGLGAAEAAEALVLTAVAMADGFISCWASKYEHNVIRPITYIQRFIDADWSTVVVTPPFPEHTSGHSVASGAAAEVLSTLLGELSFVDATHVSLGHPPRAFGSLREAAREAADSRLYGGIHYPMAVEAGLDQGECIGRQVMGRLRTRRMVRDDSDS